MATTRDMQVSKVYDAERLVWDVLESLDKTDVRTFDFYGSSLLIPAERKFGDLDGVQRYVDAVLALNWVKADYARAERPITVRARRGRTHAHYEPWGAVIAVPPHVNGISWAMREIVIIHEVAHHLTRSAQTHGPEFTQTMLHLVTELVGPEVGLLLTDSYTRHGVRFAAPIAA
ncbi:TIGR04338 family metallohydrolase [Streptomyces sp. NPDC002088]|uniref:TIGR04338 family metallohydrolase n=1 Tax=Streptomyces sp. NPDC002088 TaxID=3154665 RepID=UPI00332F137B